MAVLRKLLQLILFLAVLQLGRGTTTSQELRRLTPRVLALEEEVEEVKNSTLAIMDILVTIKEDLAALREDTRDVKRELVTVKGDTQDVKRELATVKGDTQNVKRELATVKGDTQDVKRELATVKGDTQDVKRELATVKGDTQDVKRELMTVKEDTDSALQDLKTDLNQDTNSTLMDLATLREDTNSRMQALQEGLATLRQEGSQERAEVNATVSKIQETVEEDNLIMNSVRDANQKHQQSTTEQFSNISEEIQDIQQSFLGLASQCDTSSPVTECNPLISVQYLPTSCSELPTSSPSGYYSVRSSDGSTVNVYCYMTSQQDPAPSCQYIAETYPSTPSGYYWVESSNGSAVNVYCDMARHCCGSTGGWMRVAYLDMTDTGQQCPEGFTLRSEPKRTCEMNHVCTSIFYPAHHIQYSKVCGRVRAYQYSDLYAFYQYYAREGTTIDSNYVSGMSITHGESPRKHIWTFAGALDETRSDHVVCPCTKIDAPYTGRVPPFIGNDYFCDTGSRERFQRLMYYWEDPLWDGEGCGPTSSCCQFNSPPWFCKELPQPTTDDVEVRVCNYGSWHFANVPFELIEVYIQ